jgi:ankyrin repeat protein
MLAAKEGHTNTVKAILDSNYCTTELLSASTYQGFNALMIAAFENRADTVKTILDSKYCNYELLSATNQFHDTALMIAAYKGHTDTVKAILDSKHCTPKLLSAKNLDGDNALMTAINWGRIDNAKAILASKHCTIDIIDAFLESSFSTREISDALIAAASAGNTDSVKAIVQKLNYKLSISQRLYLFICGYISESLSLPPPPFMKLPTVRTGGTSALSSADQNHDATKTLTGSSATNSNAQKPSKQNNRYI